MTTLSSSWSPDEDSSTLFSERYWLQGAIISAAAYGITVPLYALSFSHFLRKRNLPLMIYTVITFLLETTFIITVATFTQMAFIDNRNYPGGPSAFENNEFSTAIPFVGNVVSVLCSWMSDALLVWRFKVIYHRCWIPLWMVMLFPCLLYAASIAMGILFLIQVSTTNPYTANGTNFLLPCIIMSLALNIILTTAILLRLLIFKYRIVSLMGPKYGTHYTSATAILIESAALYSAISITFLVLFALGNAASQVFLQSWTEFQLIATMLILLRVTQGKEWTQNTAVYVMSGLGPEAKPVEAMPLASPGFVVALKSTNTALDVKACA